MTIEPEFDDFDFSQQEICQIELRILGFWKFELRISHFAFRNSKIIIWHTLPVSQQATLRK